MNKRDEEVEALTRPEIERQLQDTSRKLAQALAVTKVTLEATTDGIVVTEGDGIIAMYNEKFLNMWNLPAELMGLGKTKELRAAIQAQLKQSDHFNERLAEIYKHPPGQTYDLLELKNGRQVERFSRTLIVEDVVLGRVWSFRDVSDQRRAEAAERESQERLNAALIAAGMGTFRWSFASNALQTDQNLEALLGRFVGDPATTLEDFVKSVHAEDQATVVEAFRRSAREAVGIQIEFRVLHPDKSVHWIQASGKTYADPEGRPAYLTGTCANVTERRLAEDELKVSETRFRQLADSMPQIVWAARPDGVLNYFNRRWYAFSGFEEIPENDEKWITVLHPDDVAGCLQVWQESLATGKPYQIEFRLRDPEGQYRWHLVRALPVRDASGEIQRWYGSCTDIHTQRLTVDALHLEYTISEELYGVAKALSAELDLEAIVQLITDSGTRVTRAEFGAFFYNVAHEQGGTHSLFTLSGVDKSAFDNYPLPRGTSLLDPTYHGHGVVRLDDVRLDSRFGQNAPYHGMPKGHLPVVSYLAVPVTSRTGENIGGLFFGHSQAGVFTERDERVVLGMAAQAAAAMDTARLYQAEQSARTASEQANRMKDDFLAALSHELRTPLTPVLAILYNLRQHGHLPESVQQDLDAVGRNVELEARLIDDLLDLTRITRGKMELRREVIPLAKAISDAIHTCEPELQAKGLRLEQELGTGDIHVFADQARVTQIIWNLLKNAIKFTPAGGDIAVRVRIAELGKAVEISVVDTGIGIEPDRILTVFDAFEQGGREITRQFGGLGLGLAISKALADAHAGSLEVASPGSGLGSTFTLTLPLSEGPTAPRDMTSEPVSEASVALDETPPGPATRMATLLLVEDHADTAIVFSRILRTLGFKVRHAETISAALQIAEVEMAEGGVDLVISDLGLPDGSGNDLMRELALRYRLRGIALSGYGMDTDLEESTAAGFSRHLTKPVDIDVLRGAIRDVLGD